MAIVGVALVTLALVIAGVTVFVLDRRTDTASGVVRAFLAAARDGDGEKAASWWKDAGPSTEGGKRPRELVREYVGRWSAEYAKALDGREWATEESEAFLPDTTVRIGMRVVVTVGGRSATYVVLGQDRDWGIAFGPEDWIGQLSGRPHPLFVTS